MSLTEHEKYALLANVPYQLHEGVPIDVIEQELKLYGLDHEIDRELSDRVGVILHNDDEMIHSVRGTDFTNARDLISDLGLILGNPVFVKGAKTLALAESIPYALHSKYIHKFAFPSEIRNRGTTAEWEQLEHARPLFYGRQFARKSAFPKSAGYDTEESWKNALREYEYKAQSVGALAEAYGGLEQLQEQDPEHFEILKDTLIEYIESKPAYEQAIKEASKKQVKDLFKSVVGSVGSIEGLAKAGGSLPEYLRIQPERERLQKALDKHIDKTPSLTGHSLGSVVNVLGRENNIKSITFNPAPQGGDDFKGHHPDSKVYRIKGDIVSFKGFRTPEDTEPVTEFEPRYGSSFLDYHRVNQFIPDKPKPQPSRVLYSPIHHRRIVMDNKIPFDFCRYYPDDPSCIKLSREKEFY